jgi:hypothetical protein
MFGRRIAAAILPLAAALTVSAAARPTFTAAAAPMAAVLGPPWISIEYPANPFDRGSRGAYLLVHAFHHGTPVAFPVSGTAEGLVRGERRTVRLAFTPAGRPGVYALRKQWSDAGVWTLVVRVTQEAGDAATALVELAPGGEVARVQVPTARHREGDFPRAVTAAEVDAALRGRAGAVGMR